LSILQFVLVLLPTVVVRLDTKNPFLGPVRACPGTAGVCSLGHRAQKWRGSSSVALLFGYCQLQWNANVISVD